MQKTAPASKENLRISEQACRGSGVRQEGAVGGGVQPLQAHLQQRHQRSARGRASSATPHAQR